MAGDASALIYLFPFAAAGAYGLYLWIAAGISATLPSGVYLSVTRDPILFVAGSISVMLGFAIDVVSSGPSSRKARLGSLGNNLQTMAVVSLVLLIFTALYANGFTNVSGAVSDLLVGRFGLVFPAVLVLLSYLATASFNLNSLRNPRAVGIIAMLLVPAVLYEIGRRSVAVGALMALLLVFLGMALFFGGWRRKPKAQQGPSPAE
ncbi:MAG: hypothetical protein HY297_00860 [Thaumarchaeota archaeon]|nr:hypothetical protein [Nitrososphaerota archaeon]